LDRGTRQTRAGTGPANLNVNKGGQVQVLSSRLRLPLAFVCPTRTRSRVVQPDPGRGRRRTRSAQLELEHLGLRVRVVLSESTLRLVTQADVVACRLGPLLYNTQHPQPEFGSDKQELQVEVISFQHTSRWTARDTFIGKGVPGNLNMYYRSNHRGTCNSNTGRNRDSLSVMTRNSGSQLETTKLTVMTTPAGVAPHLHTPSPPPGRGPRSAPNPSFAPPRARAPGIPGPTRTINLKPTQPECRVDFQGESIN
jgi:hypothetical protein